MLPAKLHPFCLSLNVLPVWVFRDSLVCLTSYLDHDHVGYFCCKHFAVRKLENREIYVIIQGDVCQGVEVRENIRSSVDQWSGHQYDCIITIASIGKNVNSLRAKFCRGNINIHLHFMSLLHIDITKVLKILPQVRPGPTYST